MCTDRQAYDIDSSISFWRDFLKRKDAFRDVFQVSQNDRFAFPKAVS